MVDDEVPSVSLPVVDELASVPEASAVVTVDVVVPSDVGPVEVLVVVVESLSVRTVDVVSSKSRGMQAAAARTSPSASRGEVPGGSVLRCICIRPALSGPPARLRWRVEVIIARWTDVRSGTSDHQAVSACTCGCR